MSKISEVLAALNSVLLGKEHQVKLALSCILAKGHLLLEDLPGMGKTTLSYGLANVLGLDYSRIQFTSDMLPADILGGSVFEPQHKQFVFSPGPVFSQVVLADEINRATPKAQSALLEAMAEQQVSMDGQSHQLPQPFFVIATQNPLSQAGTFPLPESQLDRFLMRIELGYPNENAERRILKGENLGRLEQSHKGILNQEQLLACQREVEAVNVSDTLLDYVQRLIAFTRSYEKLSFGLSPRGALALVQAAKAWAYVEGRKHVMPEDIQAVFSAVVEHRLSDGLQQGVEHLGQEILSQVNVL